MQKVEEKGEEKGEEKVEERGEEKGEETGEEKGERRGGRRLWGTAKVKIKMKIEKVKEEIIQKRWYIKRKEGNERRDGKDAYSARRKYLEGLYFCQEIRSFCSGTVQVICIYRE